MADLARRNADSNAVPLSVHVGDARTAPLYGSFDHVLANPPWHHPADTRPPDPQRALATHRGPGDLATWVASLSAALAPGGSLTLVLPAGLTAEAIALLLGSGLRQVTLFPLWPKAVVPAKITSLQARRGAGCCRICNGIVLHGESGGYAILRGGERLALR